MKNPAGIKTNVSALLEETEKYFYTLSHMNTSGVSHSHVHIHVCTDTKKQLIHLFPHQHFHWVWTGNVVNTDRWGDFIISSLWHLSVGGRVGRFCPLSCMYFWIQFDCLQPVDSSLWIQNPPAGKKNPHIYRCIFKFTIHSSNPTTDWYYHSQVSSHVSNMSKLVEKHENFIFKKKQRIPSPKLWF